MRNALALAATALALTALVAEPAGAQVTCSPGVTLSVSPPIAAPGQPITVTLDNQSAQTVMLPTACTFRSVHAGTGCSGPSVFSPACLTVLTPVGPGQSRSQVWDQRDDAGVLVPPGAYSVEVRYFDATGAIVGCCVDVSISANAPTTYCTAKANSCGGLPAIGATGVSSATSASGFRVAAAGAKAGKCGLLIYTDAGPATPPQPFLGGLLCVNPMPLRRTVAVCDSNGAPPACDGVLAIDMNAFAAGLLGGNPQPSLSQPGASIDCQMWGRDTPGNSLLSDALNYIVGP